MTDAAAIRIPVLVAAALLCALILACIPSRNRAIGDEMQTGGSVTQARGLVAKSTAAGGNVTQNDPWTMRLLALVALTYPVGKLLWLLPGAVRRRIMRRRARPPPLPRGICRGD